MVKDKLRGLMQIQTSLQNIKTANLSNQELLANLKTIQHAYNQVDSFLLGMIDVMNASVDGVRLPSAKIQEIVGNINRQQQLNQQSLASFNNLYKAQVE